MEFKKITLKWFDAFNAHDIEALLALYDENAEHYSPKLLKLHPETNGWIKGKSQLREWWAGSFHPLPQLHYEIINIDVRKEEVFMEYIRQTPGEEDLKVGEVLVIKNGKIVESRVCHS